MAEFRDKLHDVGRGKRPTIASLKFLSDLGSEDRATLREIWPQIPEERRRRIVTDLAALSEDNIDLDFRHVFLAALEDADPKVRVTAIEGLYEDNSKLLLNRLLDLLGRDPSDDVREAAAKALGRFTYLAQCEKPGIPSERLRSGLMESARDSGIDVRRRSIESLGYLHNDGEVQQLISDAYRQGGVQAESAVFAMGRSMDERWQQTVLDELSSTRPAMRYEAAHAAGEMVLEDALPRLVEMLDDEDVEVRLSAVWALGQIGGRVAAQALAPLLESKDTAMREAAQEAVSEIAFSANPLNVL